MIKLSQIVSKFFILSEVHKLREDNCLQRNFDSLFFIYKIAEYFMTSGLTVLPIRISPFYSCKKQVQETNRCNCNKVNNLIEKSEIGFAVIKHCNNSLYSVQHITRAICTSKVSTKRLEKVE